MCGFNDFLGSVTKLALRVFGKLGVVQRIGVHIRAFALGNGGQFQEGLPFLGLIESSGQHRRAVARMVAPGELRKRHVVMQVLQRRDAGQDHIGMARGLVEVNVHADHEVQRIQRLGQTRAVGRGEHRVGAHGDQGADFAVSRGFNLFGQAGDGQLAHDLGGTTDPRKVAPGGHAFAHTRFAHRVGAKGCRLGKQHATGQIQMARERVEHIHQPACQRAVGLGAGANAGIDCCAGRIGQLTRQLANGVGGQGAALGHRLGREGGQRQTDFIDPVHPFGHRAQAHQLFVKQGVHQGSQQEHIGTRANEMVGVSHRSRLGAPGVNHHQAAAPGLQGFGFAPEIGHSPHAAVAGQRVGANDQHQVGAGNVGQGHREPVTKHQAAGQLLGHLVQGGGRKHVFGTQRPRQFGEIREQPDLVGCRIAHHNARRVASVHSHQGRQATLNLGKGFIPGGLHMHAVALDQRRAQPVRVFVQVFQGHALGADVAGAEYIGLMPANAGDLTVAHLDLKPAAGLAQGADAVVGGLGHGVLVGGGGYRVNQGECTYATRVLSRTQVTRRPVLPFRKMRAYRPVQKCPSRCLLH